MDYIAQQVAEQMKASRNIAILAKVHGIVKSHNAEIKLGTPHKAIINYPGYGSLIINDIEDQLAGIDLKMTLHPSSKTLIVEWQ